LLEAVDLARAASASFQEARKLAPDDVHGYISETQMMIRLLDYCGAAHASGMLAYLASKDASPYLRDAIERSEDLLDQVRRNREGEAPDSDECWVLAKKLVDDIAVAAKRRLSKAASP